MNRKGTEKPIEIFVALFIILAVVLVILKILNSQMVETQQDQTAQQRLAQVKLACEQRCTAASNNGCSLSALASLCYYGSINELAPGQYIDLNHNRRNDMDTSLMPGIGVCEDRVYCFQVVESCCAQRIDAQSCKKILTDYWTQQGFSSAAAPGERSDIDKLFADNMNAGACQAPAGSSVKRWDELAGWTS